MIDLSGRVVLVTGAGGTIGAGIAARFEAAGALVVRHLGREDGDLRTEAESVVSRAAARHGRLDAVVVTAAPSAQTLDPSRSADPEQVLDQVDAKAMAFLRVANAVLPPMVRAGYGRVVGVSGQNAVLTGSVTGARATSAHRAA